MIFWGRYKKIPVVKTVLENEFLRIETLNLGASLLSFVEKESSRDIVLGGSDLKSTLALNAHYMGNSVGRCVNQIHHGIFRLHGQDFSLNINNPPHSLHGGKYGIHQKVFAVCEKDNEVIYSCTLTGLEDGYPGDLQLKIRYVLEGSDLYWEVCGKSDQDTLFNISNYSYFNLLGSNGRTVIGQYLHIPSDLVGYVDATGLAESLLREVKQTAFDFRTARKIGDALQEGHPNLRLANGFNHPYVFYKEGLRATLESSDLRLQISSDYPSMHLYSANHLPGTLEGKNGFCYGAQDGICFACQYYPNAINYPEHESPILKKGKRGKHWIRYHVEKINQR